MRAKRSNKKPVITAYNDSHRPFWRQEWLISKRCKLHSLVYTYRIPYRHKFRESISKKIIEYWSKKERPIATPIDDWWVIRIPPSTNRPIALPLHAASPITWSWMSSIDIVSWIFAILPYFLWEYHVWSSLPHVPITPSTSIFCKWGLNGWDITFCIIIYRKFGPETLIDRQITQQDLNEQRYPFFSIRQESCLDQPVGQLYNRYVKILIYEVLYFG